MFFKTFRLFEFVPSSDDMLLCFAFALLLLLLLLLFINGYEYIYIYITKRLNEVYLHSYIEVI